MAKIIAEKSVEDTMQAIEKALGDIKENKASKQEVLDLIKERTNQDNELLSKAQEEVGIIKSEVDEIKESAQTMQKQLKLLRNNNHAAMKDSNGNYKGFFGSRHEAKCFGLFVIAAATAGKAVVKDIHDAAVKALDNMSIDMVWLKDNGAKSMSTTSQAGGSALATTDFIPSLIQQFENYGVFEGEALAIPMGAGETLQPKTDSLLDLYCPGEGGTISTQDPSITLITHVAKTLCALSAYSMELDEDSAADLGELLASIFVRSYAYGMDQIGFLGDGTSTYFGFTGITGALRGVDATIGNIKSLVVGAGNAYNELTLANFESLLGMLPDYADDGNAKFFNHRYFYYTVMVRLALAAGGANATEIVMGAGVRQKSFLSYPVRFTQVMPKVAANSQICSVFGNLKQGAQLGRRGALEIAQSSERYFEQALIAVRARRRVSFNVFGVGDATNAGPITGLITAAS